MARINHERARKLLNAAFDQADRQLLEHQGLDAPPDLRAPIERVFASSTQAYREVVLGCLLACMIDPSVDVRLPYVGAGERAFAGRDLDEQVVNPILQHRKVPCSRGPYLNVFRRSVKFDPATRQGLRDKKGYDAFLEVLTYVESCGKQQCKRVLNLIVAKFVELRERSVVTLSRVSRASLEQCVALARGLLATPSGGRFPVVLVAGTLEAVNSTYALGWTIQCQGINVADKASGAGGDITVTRDSSVIFAAEVTERIVDKNRVVSTFNAKIAPAELRDYLFFVTSPPEEAEATRQVRQYFSQGHEINFVKISTWIEMILATLGAEGRGAFCREPLSRLDAPEIPKTMKVAWNDQIARLTTV